MNQVTLSDFGQGSAPTRHEIKIVESSPVFQALLTENLGDKVGNWKFWQIHLCTDGVDWYTQKSHWKQNQDGSQSKVTMHTPDKGIPMNVGRANATNSEQQARFEMNSAINKQRDKKYHLPGEDMSNSLVLPMKAQKWDDCKHKVKFPVYAQPKFDGNRALQDGEKMWSRLGKVMIHQCVEHLLWDSQGYVVDGELLLPPHLDFQDTQTAAKEFKPDLSPFLMHRVYDLVIPGMPFSERFKLLKQLVKANAPDSVVVAETFKIDSEERLLDYHAKNNEEGWEGTIVRVDDPSGYAVNKRHKQLLKLKDFLDDEFLVVGVETADSGGYEGLAKLVLITKDGQTFTANPKGNTAFRKHIFENPDTVIGKMWTVRYIKYTKNKDGSQGVPFHATAWAERIPELQG